MTKYVYCCFNGVIIFSNNYLGDQIQPMAAATHFCTTSYVPQAEVNEVQRACQFWQSDGWTLGIKYYDVWKVGCDEKTI